MGLFELLLVSVGLAMDAFAVSVCGSMVLSPENRFQGAMRFGIWFGAFQALMPLLGYLGAVSFQTPKRIAPRKRLVGASTILPQTDTAKASMAKPTDTNNNSRNPILSPKFI